MCVAKRTFLFCMFMFLLFTGMVTGYSLEGDVTKVGNWSIEPCEAGDMTIGDTLINDSTIECANISNVVMYDTKIINPSRDIEDAFLEFAVISGNMLQSGMMLYGDWTYYGPFNLDNIYAGVPPSPEGTAGVSREAVSDGEDFYVTYSSGSLGYDVYLDASSVGGDSHVELSDDGDGNDAQANDGIYTSPDITVGDGVTAGERVLPIYVDDGLGNQWELEVLVYVDLDPPDGSIYISELDGHDEEEEVNSRLVTLHMTAEDDFGIQGCRLANEDEDIEEKDFVECQESRPWVLTPLNGEKNVTYQVLDVAGNIGEYVATIFLDTTAVDEPSVSVPSEYWGHTDYIEFEIYHNHSVSPGTTYEYKIYEDGDNITSWQYTEIRNVVHEGLEMEQGKNYTVGARTLSGGISETAFSEIFRIVTEPPEIISLEKSFVNGTWTSDPVLTINLEAESPNAPIKGFSYRLSEEGRNPDDNIDVWGENGTIYLTGLDPGEYSLKIKAVNYAKLSSAIEEYTLLYDNRRPPIPKATDLVPGSGTLDFNWTEVEHSPSGVSGYELNIATDRNFNDIVRAANVTGDSYEYSTSVGATYHFRIRAISGAGVYSLFSDRYGEFFDIEPPVIRNIKPQGRVSRSSPVLSVETDRSSECYYRPADEAEAEQFEFTGGTFHDTRLNLDDGESYEYVILCYNVMGEVTSGLSEFNIDDGREPGSMHLGSDYGDGIEAYSGSELNFMFDIRSGGEPLGEIDLGRFSVYIDGYTYEDFSVNDRGNGSYMATLVAPEEEGVYHAMVCFDEVMCLEDITIFVSEIGLEMRIGNIIGDDVQSGEKMMFHDDGTNTFGLASDSDLAVLEIDENGHITLNNRHGSGTDFIFFVPSGISSHTLSEKDNLLLSRDFLDEIVPTFSRASDDELSVVLSLHHKNIVVSGKDVSDARRISLENLGLTRDRKVNISIVAE